jgi:hypothetical protein
MNIDSINDDQTLLNKCVSFVLEKVDSFIRNPFSAYVNKQNIEIIPFIRKKKVVDLIIIIKFNIDYEMVPQK